MKKWTLTAFATMLVAGLGTSMAVAQSEPLEKDPVEKRLRGGTSDELLERRGRFDAVDVDRVEINDSDEYRGTNERRQADRFDASRFEGYDEVEADGRYYYRDGRRRLVDPNSGQPARVRSGVVIQVIPKGTIEGLMNRSSHDGQRRNRGNEQYGSNQPQNRVNAAVVVFSPMRDSQIDGHVRMERNGDQVRCWGDVSGLSQGQYCLCVHQFGNMLDSAEGQGIGDQYQWRQNNSDQRQSNNAKRGQFATFKVNKNGKAQFDKTASLPLGEFVGRSVVIHELGNNGQPKKAVAFGIVGITDEATGSRRGQKERTSGYRGTDSEQSADDRDEQKRNAEDREQNRDQADNREAARKERQRNRDRQQNDNRERNRDQSNAADETRNESESDRALTVPERDSNESSSSVDRTKTSNDSTSGPNSAAGRSNRNGQNQE
ncbi:superoxide dismutase family protein [Stratiformator vulcanicus]|uniref:Copper/zinc superoxide dismutase (SODC) n=1 Tax=Stratiformator vulcanicus TaxID=2527980 RepID=A0A517QVZ7_9PLAN|nr:superoxide dismutase family protein [Stratiformator vulcanicus]QDT35835.1 Copper/zinc superoxide dismutase (SODC) [Stratiformator vulcanicus]